MQRIIMLLIIAGLGFWCSKNGIFYNLTHEMKPEPNRECVLKSLFGEGVYVAPDKDDLKYAIDVRIGTQGQKLEAAQRLSAVLNAGTLGQVAEGTKAKVLASGSLELYSAPYYLTQVKVQSGELSGTSLWVERDNCIDSPIMEAYAAMRTTPDKRK